MVPWIDNPLYLQKIINFSPKVDRLFKDNKKLLFLLIVLICLSVFFRFYNFSDLMYWMFDEERDAFVVKRILVDKHPTLIGGAIPGAFYLAPGYFYISAIFYLLSGGNPLGPAIAASALGIISTLLLFFVSRELFNKKVATFTTIIYCVSYLVVIYNRTWWPLTFAPTIAISTYYSLYKLVKFHNLRWSIPLSIALIVGAQSDPSNFSLIVLTILVWIFFRLPIVERHVGTSIFLFLFSHFPLVLFDVRHDFFNTKLILKMLSFESAGGAFNPVEALKGLVIFPRTLSRFLFISRSPDMALQIVPFQYYVDQKFGAIPFYLLGFSITLISAFLYKFSKSFFVKDSLGAKLIGGHLLISIIGILAYNTFFPGYTHEWFLQVLFPAFSIIVGLFIAEIYSVFLHIKNLRFLIISIWLAIAVFLWISIDAILNAKNSFNFADKSNAVKWTISKVGSKDFSLDSISSSFSYGGYRYLFYLYGHEPVKSYMDPVFVDWMYPAESIAKEHPNLVVAIANPDFYFDPVFNERYQKYLGKTIIKEQFGRIEVLIVDNSEKWVDW